MEPLVHRHDYTQTMTYKIFLAWKSKPTQCVSFEDALALIRRHVHTPESYEVHFSNDLTTTVRKRDRRYRLLHGDRLLAENTDVLLPTPWAGNGLLSYSRTGGRRTWELPPDWHGITRAELHHLTAKATMPLGTLAVNAGQITLGLQPGQAIYLLPL